MRDRRVTPWLKSIVLLTVGLAVGWLFPRGTGALGAPAPAVNPETALVDRRDIGATVLATGVIRPKVGAQVAVGSRASGVLEKLHVTVGDRVTAGQLLAELDRVAYAMEVERADASLRDAAAERIYAEVEHARVRQLADRSAASAAELSAADRLVATTRAREREAAANLEAARVQLGYTSIRAPIDGVIASVSTQEGETVAASFAAPTFLTIVDLDRLEVWAYVDETDIGRIEVGQQARFTVDTYPDETFHGRVTAVRPTAELRDNVVNYVTVIEIEHREGTVLRPEMTATMDIVLNGRTDALSVPNSALRRDASGTFVLVPAAGSLERREVRVGFRGSEYSELLAGVATGDLVVVGSVRDCESGTPLEGGT